MYRPVPGVNIISMSFPGKKIKGNIYLLLTAFIWGSAFVAQKTGMDYTGPFTFNCLRSLLGAAVLIPFAVISVKRARARTIPGRGTGHAGNDDPAAPEGSPGADDMTVSDALLTPSSKRALIKGGICCGIAMFAAMSLQQTGLLYTTSGKAGFITALYIIIVPILRSFFGKKVRPFVWFCVGLVVAGLYLLTVHGPAAAGRGDLLMMACAFFFAVHILVIDRFTKDSNPIAMCAVQLFVVGVLSLPFMLIFEEPDASAVMSGWLPLVYAGVLSSGVAYSLDMTAQKFTDPVLASLIISLESVFAALMGFILLGETLSPRELLGCALMLAAIVLVQLPPKDHGSSE